MNARTIALIGALALAAGCRSAPQTAEAAAGAADQEQRPEDTEVWEPEPAVVTPGEDGAPPSDAIVLFDGTSLSNWTTEDGGEPGWRVANGAMTVVAGAGSIETRQGFGSMQLHIEWRTPAVPEGEGQERGNSGVYLMKLYEVQVLDSYNNRTYSNGQAGSIYKQHIPLVNASRGPGEWQAYDIVFTAPTFNADGSLVSPAYVTVLHNGVLIQNHVQLQGPTLYIGTPKYEAHPDRLPILLQDHGNPVSYRNIWVRELN
jgi:3-keto-disaccharide hydrolase